MIDTLLVLLAEAGEDGEEDWGRCLQRNFVAGHYTPCTVFGIFCKITGNAFMFTQTLVRTTRTKFEDVPFHFF